MTADNNRHRPTVVDSIAGTLGTAAVDIPRCFAATDGYCTFTRNTRSGAHNCRLLRSRNADSSYTSASWYRLRGRCSVRFGQNPPTIIVGPCESQRGCSGAGIGAIGSIHQSHRAIGWARGTCRRSLKDGGRILCALWNIAGDDAQPIGQIVPVGKHHRVDRSPTRIRQTHGRGDCITRQIVSISGRVFCTAAIGRSALCLIGDTSNSIIGIGTALSDKPPATITFFIR